LIAERGWVLAVVRVLVRRHDVSEATGCSG
jgi:hypothetical protein